MGRRRPPAAAAKQASRPRRLTAEARRSSILRAARRAFTETGDMNGTTIRHIADRAGISEGVIYRHFESKDQLFYEAVVEPLRAAVDELVAASDAVDRTDSLTLPEQERMLRELYRQLVETFVEMLPLLGLVLFGDPKVAQRFYREHFGAAMDRLAEAWLAVERRHGVDHHPDISARAVLGVALVLALEARHRKDFDAERALELVSEGTMRGFFPHFELKRTT